MCPTGNDHARPPAPTRTEVHLPVGDDDALATTWHRPPSGTVGRGVTVVAPGVAVPARRTHPLADELAGRGWTAVTFDYLGMAASATDPARRRRGDRFRDWGRRDLDAVLRAARSEADHQPVVLVGHSAGAWLVGLTPAAAEVDALVGLASWAGYWGNFPRHLWPRMLAYWYLLFPLSARLLGHVPGDWGLGLDLPGGVAREWARWNRRSGFYPSDPRVAEDLHLDQLRAPVVDLLPTDDEWGGTEAAARSIWEAFPHARVSYRPIEPEALGAERLGHLGLLSADHARAVTDVVVDTIDDAVSARPGLTRRATAGPAGAERPSRR